MKKKKTISMVIMFVMISIVIGCGSAEVKTKEAVPAQTNITSLQVEPYGFNKFILRFSNLIREFKGKKLTFPIFQGTFGDVLYDDYLNYCWKYELLEEKTGESGFIIKCRRGEIKKTLYEFLAFYKSNILKNVDIENPVVEYSYGMYAIIYDFELNGVPCSMIIQLIASMDNNYKTIYDLKPDENVSNTSFIYNIKPRTRF